MCWFKKVAKSLYIVRLHEKKYLFADKKKKRWYGQAAFLNTTFH